MGIRCGSATSEGSRAPGTTAVSAAVGKVRRVAVAGTIRQPCFAYLSDWEAVGGTAGLFAGKRSIDSFALGGCFEVVRYFIDSGRADGLPVISAGLGAMMKAIAVRDDIRVVVVAGLDTLALRTDGVGEVIKRLSARGVQVIDATNHAGPRAAARERRSPTGEPHPIGIARLGRSHDRCL